MSAAVCSSTGTVVTEADVRRALDSVVDPELDEPITDLGFVSQVSVDDGRIEVHLRLPTSFCSPNFAYLMASDAKDALTPLGGAVAVLLVDHHDSELINRGLAADAGYRGTFGHEAEDSLDELRAIFHRKSHVAAMERALTELLHANPQWTEADLVGLTIAQLPEGRTTAALLRRRATLGWSTAADAVVFVDDAGAPVGLDAATLRLRMARSVRISIDGNAHFCRGLLRTRYPGSGEDQAVRADGDGAERTLLPLL